jgi:hypothetical protein
VCADIAFGLGAWIEGWSIRPIEKARKEGRKRKKKSLASHHHRRNFLLPIVCNHVPLRLTPTPALPKNDIPRRGSISRTQKWLRSRPSGQILVPDDLKILQKTIAFHK